MLTAVQASPHNKVATLSGESLELMASARTELQCMHKQVCQHQASFATPVICLSLFVGLHAGFYCVSCLIAKFLQSPVLQRLSSDATLYACSDRLIGGLSWALLTALPPAKPVHIIPPCFCCHIESISNNDL